MPKRFQPHFAEVLVAVVILGMLAALLLPAVQSARERGPHSLASPEYRRAAAEPAGAILQNHSASPADAPPLKARYVNFQQPQIAPRRIIFDANISLVVKKLADTDMEITKFLKQVDGYVADASVDRIEGQKLTGLWKVRVPVTKFDAFLDDVSKLGVAENRRQTAQDVTEEYVDLEAQITNKKRLEERIVALLKDATGKIKDVLEVESELARVRGEIEQMEGRLRYLTNRTDFTTITISAREEENYVPPAAPTFMNRIAQAWNSSIDGLQSFGQHLTIAAVYVSPWMIVAAAIAIPGYFYVRRRQALRASRA